MFSRPWLVHIRSHSDEIRLQQQETDDFREGVSLLEGSLRLLEGEFMLIRELSLVLQGKFFLARMRLSLSFIV